MPARIGLSTGKEWVVEGTVDATASSMMGADPFTVIEAHAGDASMRVCVFRAHVAYVEDVPQSVYETRPSFAVLG
jgi:hypothetical protein